MQLKNHPITEAQKADLRYCLCAFRQAGQDQLTAVEAIANLLGCSTDDAIDLCNSSDGLQRTLDKCVVEIAPNEPQLRVVHPPGEREQSCEYWERVETIIVVLLSACLVGGLVGAAWMWGE